MKYLAGKITRKETGEGIAGLLMEIYDQQSSKSRKKAGSPNVDTAAKNSRWQLLGKATTDDAGTFTIAFPNMGGGVRNDSDKFDAALIVSFKSTPDKKGSIDYPPVVSVIKRNILPSESILITVNEIQLRNGGVPHWSADPVVREADKRHEFESRREKMAEESREQEILRAAKARLEGRKRFAMALKESRDISRKVDEKFSSFLSAISSSRGPNAMPVGSRLVRNGQDILETSAEAIRTGIEHRINTAIRSFRLPLSLQKMMEFEASGGRMDDESTSNHVRDLLPWKRTPARLRRTPPRAFAEMCNGRKAEQDECERVLANLSINSPPSVPEAPHQAQSSPAPLTGDPSGGEVDAAGLALQVGRLLSDVTSPESAVVFGLGGRANLDKIRTGIGEFTLHAGPADTPALFDFHQLQVAFEHVWQDLFDEKLVKTGRELYAKIVEVGEDPNDYLLEGLEVKPDKKAPPKSMPGEEKSHPTESVLRAFDLTAYQWGKLYTYQQKAIESLAATYEDCRNALYGLSNPSKENEYFLPENKSWLSWMRERMRTARQEATRIINYANAEAPDSDYFDQFHQLLQDLKTTMKEPYRFSIFAANRTARSINFGIVTTYRQEWVPQSYQVGKLVKTVPLAPKEVRRFSKKTTIRTNRSEKEVQNNLHSRKSESSETARTESEIVQKAMNKSNFKNTAKGSVNLEFASFEGSNEFGGESAEDSSESKKVFHEAVFKAAEEYKSERNIEINVGSSEEIGTEESGEISNPNDEIPVTYLFYELQRRYRVKEHLHQVTPVVLVAQEFPEPGDIDDDWIIAHDWILRRSILDDSFVPAINYLSTKVVGDENQLKVQRDLLDQMRRIQADLKEDLVEIRDRVGQRYSALEKATESRAEAIQADENEGFFESAIESFSGSADQSAEALRVREDAARDAYEREAKLEKELVARLERETTALNSMADAYTKNLSEHLNRRTQISRLRVHIKSNIMHYMQAIWNYEPPDQRFFRLHEVKVPKLKGTMTYVLQEDPDGLPVPPSLEKPFKVSVKCKLDPKFELQSLAEIADLDNLLGFKGNYMIFPLKESNDLTSLMMAPYFDPIRGLADPSDTTDWTLSEFIEYVCCLRKKLAPEEFAKLLPELSDFYRKLSSKADPDGEEIVLPTNSLFIEALPGAHPILEDFKLAHRGVDVKKVQAEVRGMEFENLRKASRLVKGEFDDPNIDKKIVVEGNLPISLNPIDP